MKCAIYMRVGRKEQLDACEDQKEMLMDYAKENGLEVVEEYSDAGFSGNDANRPGLAAMNVDYAGGKFEQVLAVDMSRLSRKPAAFPFPVQTVK